MKNNEMPMPKKKLSTLQSIKFYCKESCCAGDMLSWRDCPSVNCVLWKFRLGIGNKAKGRKLTEKHKQILIESRKKEVIHNGD